MEARPIRAAIVAAVLLVSMGASHRSANFVVQTHNPQLAERIAKAAEQYRKDLAVEWLGHTMPNWSAPCTMSVRVGPNLGAGGATTFVFDRGEVYGWRMSIQGSAQRVLDSVLPHEITHMIFASHFRRPLPRWADEGAATSVEHTSERTKHFKMLHQFLRTGRGIAFNRMFAMTEYPRDVMPLYAQGFSLVEFLIGQGGRRKYVDFLDEGLDSNNWEAAIRKHYGIRDLGQLQNTWLAWVRQGFPPLKPHRVQPESAPSESAPSASMLADSRKLPRPEPNLIYRIRSEAPGDTRPAGFTQPAGATVSGNPARNPSSHATLPPSGWRGTSNPMTPNVAAHPPTQVAVKPSSTPVPMQLARQQSFEKSRQIILEWRKR